MTTANMPKRGSDSLFAFAASSFDRGGERREDADWVLSLRRDPRATLIQVAEDGFAKLTEDGAALARQPLPDVESENSPSLLGFEAGAPVFAAATRRTPEHMATPFQWSDLRSIAARLPAYEAGLAAYARALLYWQSRSRFCGRCGSAARLIAGGHRATCEDPSCETLFFPRTDAAVIVLVEHAGRALLGRQASWGPHRFSTLAGFVEPGETLEDAVRREVREESAVVVGEVRYQASQPWPFPASLMIGFRAEALSDTIEVGDELVEARWFSPGDIDAARVAGTLQLSPRLSISRWLLDAWYRERTGRTFD